MSKRAGAWAFGLGCVALSMLLVGAGVEMKAQTAHNEALTLDHGWQFRQMGKSEWLPATVPGDVHLDLLANKKIGDPFYRDNEAKLQWIEKEGWEYALSFDLKAETLRHGNVDLVFDGLDGASEVELNGHKVLSTHDSFRIWRVASKSYLVAGKNELKVSFPSAPSAADKLAAEDPWFPKTKVEAKTYLRKPAYEYGWDWGPRFVTSGIWKPVRLEAWDKVRIDDFAIRQPDVTRQVAHLNAQVDLEASTEGMAKVEVSFTAAGKPVELSSEVHVHPGHNLVQIPFEIHQPKLWFPAGYGAQPLYEFKAAAFADGVESDEQRVKTGLRSIVLDRHPDQWGRSFQLVVNGIPVFAKGADVIPFDSFPNRVTVADYRRILESAKEANMNMIRHWGGGYYETKEFFEICDELGIMVWQDFMFGNDWQPGAYSFKLNIEAEAEDQVKRLRNHPSIVIWCGNNETEIAMGWAPRPALPLDVRYQMWQDYLTEFSGILPRVVAKLDAETPYWPSSPSADYEQVSDKYHSGDDHIWDVWHGRVPFSTYETHHSRFVTEYGFQSFPEMKTVESFTEPGDRTGILTPVMLAHQKNNEGNDIIHNYLLKDYQEPKDFASFLYVSQVLQAEGIKIGAEHFRRSRPETMGSIFWQLNDCWPVASWSSIDYYGRWKALQYYARRFYAPVLVSPHVEEGVVKVYVVSDKTEAKKATLRVRLMDFDGKVLLEESEAVTIDPLSSKVLLNWPLKKLTDAGARDTSKVFVVAELSEGAAELSRNLLYIAPTKEIHLKPAQLKIESEAVAGGLKVRVSSPVLARSVYLSEGELDARYSENYFDLLPGETVEVHVSSKTAASELKSKLQVISLTDAFSAASTQAAVRAAK